jgi:hypothetical protein
MHEPMRVKAFNDYLTRLRAVAKQLREALGDHVRLASGLCHWIADEDGCESDYENTQSYKMASAALEASAFLDEGE